MGGCISNTNEFESQEMRDKQKQIESQLRQDKKKMQKEIKLLLLGAGESGKSTLAKQMKVIYLGGFEDDERVSFRDIVHSNVIQSMRSLIIGAEKLGVPIEVKNKDRAIKLSSTSLVGSQGLTPELADDIELLWKDQGIQSIYKRSNEFQLGDSAEYFLSGVHRFAKDDYVPSEQDVLMARAKTTGITETEFNVGETHFRMVDVGGQRSERKKWIHCFQDVTSLIFFVGLSEYNQRLYEDENVNRMHESIRLFDEIVNSRWFKDTAIILFLNKRDLFAKKIEHTDLKCCFPDYTGGCKYEPAINFIKAKFESLNKTETVIYTQVTCATDTDNIKFVFQSVQDIIYRQSLEGSGF
eukprot:CAMPEP_0201550522 /NCGR_PEP_ID=MMETSP0173_2-20130828/6882_1 /ASSEMBLY_ACC=CAM_ASM_000268 /TAXON_ID=218659 /ORGANISM="Vexillifera sp., Strain DIVA3 564/2" /LENGTH=353 /DNA_ID=CAMNT_0047960525 /DNA_START=6 /DNA_END=1067 /DNA_ORIENTATION=-